MRRMMGAIAVSVLLAGCGGSRGAAPPAPAPAPLRGTAWVVEEIDRRGVIDRARVTVVFDEEGGLSGRAGCNSYRGRWRRGPDGVEIRGPLAGTMMACAPALMEQEQRFLRVLERVTGHRLDERTGLLTLRTDDGRTLRLARDTGTPGGVDPRAPIVMRCRNDELHVRLGRDEARLTFMPERREVTLPQSQRPYDPPGTRVYSNGRLTFVWAREQGRTTFSFARGKMVPEACIVAPN